MCAFDPKRTLIATPVRLLLPLRWIVLSFGSVDETARVYHAGRVCCGHCLAGNGARTAVDVTRHRVPTQRDSECLYTHDDCVSQESQRSGVCRGSKRNDRVPLGGGSI